MLSDEELINMCQCQNIELNYCGYKDTMPNITNQTNYNCIINIDGVDKNDNNVSGSHWVCVIIKDNNAFYFDSFGLPEPIETMKFIKNQNIKHYGYNKKQIQNINDDHCGYYCFALLSYVKHYFENDLYNTVNNFINLFNKNTKKNKNILLKML